MAVAGAHAVGAGVAAADDDDVLAGGHDLALELVAGVDLVLLRQELHGEVDAVEFAPRNRQVARMFGAAGQQHRIELGQQLLGAAALLRPVGDRGAGAVLGHLAHQHAGGEAHAFGLHLRDAAVDVVLLHLEVGNAVAQQAADAVVLLEHGHVMPGARQLLRGRQAGRAGTHHGDALAGLVGRRLRHDPTHLPALVDDGVLDRLDAHRGLVDAQGAGRLARRGADAPGELGEVVGRVQRVQRAAPVALPHEVVEVGNDVVHRAAVVAEGDAAVHAAPGLDLGLVVRQFVDEFLPVLEARRGRLVALLLAFEFHESGDFSHALSLVCDARNARALSVYA
ncbi:hypothetical protein GALL_294800 [mine drainage metagenome]|uniref:Uncharacterized protein n=1 Tax=mine drainage metagenome TaxID=410659 RepID=A0A1J5QY66_9ZZZZ